MSNGNGKKAATRAAQLRQGLRIPPPLPDPAPVWVVRYIRTNGDVVTRYFSLEYNARACAERWASYGKTPSIFHTASAVKWVRVA